jgi:hypothetical protein
MKSSTALVTALFAVASFPLLAQQPPPTSSPATPPTQQNPPEAAPPASSAASQEASASPAVAMSPVNGELVSKLDSKTAKTGDSVVIQTDAAVKTADGTEIPKGSKLVGHVLGVQASTEGQNSQMALQFDHVELQGGQSVPVQSQIQSITPAGGAANAGSSASSVPQGTGDPRATPGSRSSTPGSAAADAAGSNQPAAGTVVSRTGNIAISTTSVPGVLVANNAPGQRDPRMAQASSILLGAQKDIQLDSGTQMVLAVAPTGGGAH